MKRYGNLYHKICSVENLKLADEKARKGKRTQSGVIRHDLNRDDNLINLHHVLVNKEYKTSRYQVFTIREPKVREIFKLPYYPDRIVHHAIMNIMEPIFVSTFTRDTYNCIKKRGIYGAYKTIKKYLRSEEETTYCLKLDIKKFYPNIDHKILKDLLRTKLKDDDLLWLLDEIIDSTDGIPIGNYLSQYLANFYLTKFDHWLKETKRVKYYLRYCDDIVILSNDKQYLHNLLADIREYLDINLKLTIKANYQVFPVKSRGIDFVGYRFYHTHILVRKGIKKNFIRMIRYRRNTRSIASYNSWLVHSNSKNLIKKYLYDKGKANNN